MYASDGEAGEALSASVRKRYWRALKAVIGRALRLSSSASWLPVARPRTILLH
jgi:hypothetical protein